MGCHVPRQAKLPCKEFGRIRFPSGPHLVILGLFCILQKIPNLKAILKPILVGILTVAWIYSIGTFILPFLETEYGTDTAIGFFFYKCVLTPFWEELWYRHVPFQITYKVNKFTKQDFTFLALLLTSLNFAIDHFPRAGINAMLWQVAGGFMIGWLYVTTKKRPYLAAVLAHFTWNFMVFYGIDWITKFFK